MDGRLFERQILNLLYRHPGRHWELDAQGQPTGRIIEARRTAQFITPIPRPRTGWCSLVPSNSRLAAWRS